MSKWVPITNHTHYSLLKGVSKPKQIAKRCKELGYTAAGMTDYGNIGGAVQFSEAMKKEGIKPILGMEAYISNDTNEKEESSYNLTHLPVIAKNLGGWKNLISCVSYSYSKERQYKDKDKNVYPRIEKEKLSELGRENVIAFSGHKWSELANSIFIDYKKAYVQHSYDELKAEHVHPDWERRMVNVIEDKIDLFGRDNFYVAVNFSGARHCPATLYAARCAREVAKKYGYKSAATFNSFYPKRQDAPDQRVLLCSALKTTFQEIQKRLVRQDETTSYLRPHFQGEGFYIPALDELQRCYSEEELVNAAEIADICESYSITHSPIVPAFPCPDGMTADDYLVHLCKQAWNRKVKNRVNEDKWQEYRERIRRELAVIKEAGLSSYFLIVQDYCNWARSVGMIVGPGRGSGAGCLISYLIGITSVDPIKYGLSFERFYNAGRNTPGHISLPDIDCDFPVLRRKEIVAYLKAKYGDAMVANIATFNSLKGRGAVTEVFRAYNVEFETVKRITANIPQEHRITEELQQMKDRGDEPSIIRFALDNDPDAFREWVTMDEAGKCEGPYGSYFEQAMRLEGTKRNISTHAAGVVLSSTPLADLCPLIYDDKLGGSIAGMEYPDLESMGRVKLDVLGVNCLDKINSVRDLLRQGYIDEEDKD